MCIEYATDLKEIYPEKEVTLLHSRQRLMPIYPIAMHTASKYIRPFIAFYRADEGSNGITQ